MRQLKFDANLRWLFTELPLEDRIQAAAEAGFHGVEIPDPYQHDLADLRRRINDTGMAVVLINTERGPDGSPSRSGYACLPEHMPEFRKVVDQGLEAANALESQYLHVVAGVQPPGFSRERIAATYILNMAWAAERAAAAGVSLLIEPQNKRDVPGFFLESQAHAVELISALNVDNVKLLLDVYHVQIDEGDVLRVFDESLPSIGHIQIADPPRRTEPGTGELNWRTVFTHIAASGYKGWVGCEYGPQSSTTESLSWMKEWV